MPPVPSSANFLAKGRVPRRPQRLDAAWGLRKTHLLDSTVVTAPRQNCKRAGVAKFVGRIVGADHGCTVSSDYAEITAG